MNDTTIENNQNIFLNKTPFDNQILDIPKTSIIPARTINPIHYIEDDQVSYECFKNKNGKTPKHPREFFFKIWDFCVVTTKKQKADDPDFYPVLLRKKNKNENVLTPFHPTYNMDNFDVLILHKNNEAVIQQYTGKSVDEIFEMIGFYKQKQFVESMSLSFDVAREHDTHRVKPLITYRVKPFIIYFDKDGNGYHLVKMKDNANFDKVRENIPCWYYSNAMNISTRVIREVIVNKYTPNPDYHSHKRPMLFNEKHSTDWSSVCSFSIVKDYYEKSDPELPYFDFNVEDLQNDFFNQMKNEVVFKTKF